MNYSAANKVFQSDQSMLSCLLLAQKSRQHTLAAEERRYVLLGQNAGKITTMNQYTAAIQRDGEFWIGWVEEVPGVNSQAETKEELIKFLHSALSEALEMNRQEAQDAAGANYEEVRISA